MSIPLVTLYSKNPMKISLAKMKKYNYFLFRIFRFYKDKAKEHEAIALISVTAVSTLIVSLNIIAIYLLVNLLGLIPILTNKLIVIIPMLVIGFINHHYFVRKKRFLSYGFRKDKKGGLLVMSYILCSFILPLTIGHYNRQKIFEGRTTEITHKPQRESLEGKIRKWLE
ncbi:hypothetical protein [Cognataquiflexum rubidum]|uniref:hypothetical protein n=1 Tax=Cognataquiflexum rubidum TaxID=2922273 RepID=UPI001F12A68C|nr:hypothetical protein [Cognataquiflexum rubidum]MCH6235457.1 hypothetical protein [Cognataquiflexum rubidum]